MIHHLIQLGLKALYIFMAIYANFSYALILVLVLAQASQIYYHPNEKSI